MSSYLQDEVYIVTEYCDGGNALEYLNCFRLSHTYEEFFRVVIKLCMGVCDAMHYLHSNDYTHRDLNVTNIMVKRGKALLGDFGLSRHLSESEILPYNSIIPNINALYCPPEVLLLLSLKELSLSLFLIPFF